MSKVVPAQSVDGHASVVCLVRRHVPSAELVIGLLGLGVPVRGRVLSRANVLVLALLRGQPVLATKRPVVVDAKRA